MNRQFLSYQYFEQCVREVSVTSPILSEFMDSVSLIGNKVREVFTSKSLPVLAVKSIKVEHSLTKIKKQIIYKCLHDNGNELLVVMDNYLDEEIQRVGLEFFGFTCRKFAKNHSIEHFSVLLKRLIQVFGIQDNLIYCFMSSQRESDEINILLDYVRKWDLEIVDEVLNRMKFLYLKKFLIHHSFLNFEILLKSTKFSIKNPLF